MFDIFVFFWGKGEVERGEVEFIHNVQITECIRRCTYTHPSYTSRGGPFYFRRMYIDVTDLKMTNPDLYLQATTPGVHIVKFKVAT